MLKKVVMFLLSISFLALSMPANAVWKGAINTENKRAVSILLDSDVVYCSSGFLYSQRLVFTAAHVLFKENDIHKEQITKHSSIWVGYPNDTLDRGVRRVIVEKFFIPEGYKSRTAWLGGNRLTRLNDFAVLVLKSPLPLDDKPVELLTKDLHQKYIENSEQINLTGYGIQSADQASRECLKRQPRSYESTVTSMSVSAGSMEFTTTLNTRVGPGMPNLCDGDSGAGFIKILPDKYIYLGAAGAGSLNQHNCETHLPAINLESINGSDPVYLFKELIDQAEKYVKDNPHVESNTKNADFNGKKIITCVKGKTIKKVTGLTLKCPKGYKKK
jgi:hypothetical protein